MGSERQKRRNKFVTDGMQSHTEMTTFNRQIKTKKQPTGESNKKLEIEDEMKN